MDRFGVPRERDLEGEIIDRRNNLFHEGRWGPFFPLAHEDERGANLLLPFENLIERLFAGLVGYQSDFVHTGWNTYSQVSFRPDPSLLAIHRS